MKKCRKRSWKASYTVEAALIVPLVIFSLAFAITLGFSLYQEIEGQIEQESVADMWEVKNFYTYQMIEEVFND